MLAWNRPTWKRLGRPAAIGGAALFLALLLIPGPGCNRGQGLSLLLVPWLSLLVVAITCERHLVVAFSTFSIIAAIVIGNIYTDLVHVRGITGNPGGTPLLAAAQLRALEVQITGRRSGLDLNRVLPAGWLDESALARDNAWLAEELKPDPKDGRGFREEASRWWPSGFSRLYPVRYIRLGAWYPGGKVGEAIPRLEVRDRS